MTVLRKIVTDKIANNIFIEINRKMVLFTVVGLILFGYGFQLLRIPPRGFGVPLAEIVLFFSLILLNPALVTHRLKKVFPVWVLYAWVAYGSIHLILAFGQYGYQAVRQASPIYEALFLYVGFGLSCDDKFIILFVKILKVCIFLLLGYALLYPVREIVFSLSPVLISTQGKIHPIFGNYSSTPIFMVVFSSIALRHYYISGKTSNLFLGGGLILTAIILFPSRTLILELVIVTLLLLYLYRGYSKQRKFVLLGFLITFLVVFSLLGATMESRLGSEFSLTDYSQLASEIFQVNSNSNQLSSGNDQRIEHWADIIGRWSDSFSTIVVGLGYGVPLIKFIDATGALVTEPHNSFISVLGRGGLVGFGLFIVLKFSLFKVLYNASNTLKEDEIYGDLFIFSFVLFICMLINGLGEAPYVSPYLAVPYYFTVGVALRAYSLRKTNQLLGCYE